MSEKDLNKQMLLLLETQYYLRTLFQKTGLQFVDLSESKQNASLLCTMSIFLLSVVCMSRLLLHVSSNNFPFVLVPHFHPFVSAY